MTLTVKWLPKPQDHDSHAAEDYLPLLMSGGRGGAA